MKSNTSPKDVAGYIAAFPVKTRGLLRKLRTIIRKTAPDAEEKISYGMPAYKYHGMLAYFAGYKNHIGFYPGTAAILAFKKQLAGYKTSKGTVQFPLDKPLPEALIRDITAFRVIQNESKALARRKK